jgi:hypothetical protein
MYTTYSQHRPAMPASLRRLVRPLMLALCSLSLLLAMQPAAAQGESRFFPETGQTVSGPFLDYWQQNGGLALFGYPIGDAHDEVDPISGKTYRVQWFERERFELHPEYAGTSHEVLLGLLGRQLTRGREDEPAFQPVDAVPTTTDYAFFPETRHSISFEFKTYWEQNGGLPIFGYPISEPFEESNPSDGLIYTVQYFERARFELHPEQPAPYRVLLGRLGAQLMPAASPAIQIAAGPTRVTIGPDQTALLPAGTTRMTVTLDYDQQVDPQTAEAQVSQIAGTTAWRVVPTEQTSTGTTFVFSLEEGGDGSYTRVQVTQGTGNPATFFGIQIGGSRADGPSLVAGWTDPVTLVHSFYNAINRRELQRAYSYWETPGAPNGVSADFDDFVRGYTSTQSATVTTGAVLSDAGAGNVFFAVPVAISAPQTGGSLRQYYGCYLLHRVNVELGDTTPPYPIMMRAARIFDAPANTTADVVLARATAFVQSGQCTQ